MLYATKDNKCMKTFVDYIDLGLQQKNEQGVFYIEIDKKTIDLSKNLVLCGLELEEIVATENLKYTILPVKQVTYNPTQEKQTITLEGTYVIGPIKEHYIKLAVIPSDIPI